MSGYHRPLGKVYREEGSEAMNRKKERIIEFAKELYLTPNEAGNHKYSLRSISAEIEHKFSKKLANTTILNWSRKYGWDKLWEEGVREGITEALAKEQSERTKEEQFKEAIAKKKQQDFTMMTNLKVLAYKFIRENGFSNVNEALKAMETGMKYTQDLDSLNETEGSLSSFLMRLINGKNSQ